MDFEIVDKRKLKAEAEAAAPMEPDVFAAGLGGALEAAVATGDAEEINRVSSECGGGPAYEKNVVPFKKTVRGEVQSWKSVGFVVAFLPMGQAQVLMVRAVGIRSDERLFTADYAMPPVWGEGEDFTEEAFERLSTFKACCCDGSGQCKFHGEALPGPKGAGKWLESDLKRLQSIQGSQLPEAVEVLMKVEAERANSRIVVPGRQ